jgi:hypothetical protein
MSEPRQATLVLVSANKSRGGGHWSADDYDVRFGGANGKVVGRILKSETSPAGRKWFWTITEQSPQQPSSRGYAATRAEAIGAFRQAWGRMTG